MSTLHHVNIADGPFLELTLGLKSQIGRLDALLERYASPSARCATDDEPHPHALDLVLGLIAMRNQIERELAGLARPPETSSSPRVMKGLLR